MKIIIRRLHVKLQIRHMRESIAGLTIRQKIRKEIEFIRTELGEIIPLLVMLIRPKEWVSIHRDIEGTTLECIILSFVDTH